jgi:hypothetical protein
MILTLVLFGAILPLHQRLKKTLPVGVLGMIYLGLYAVGRFFLSYYRTDPAVFAGLRQAQLASLLMVVIAAIAIPILFQRRTSTKPAEVAPAEEAKDVDPVAVVGEPVQSVVTEPEPIEPALAKRAAVEPVAEPDTVLPAPVVPKTPTPDPAPTPTDPDPSKD